MAWSLLAFPLLVVAMANEPGPSAPDFELRQKYVSAQSALIGTFSNAKGDGTDRVGPLKEAFQKAAGVLTDLQRKDWRQKIDRIERGQSQEAALLQRWNNGSPAPGVTSGALRQFVQEAYQSLDYEGKHQEILNQALQTYHLVEVGNNGHPDLTSEGAAQAAQRLSAFQARSVQTGDKAARMALSLGAMNEPPQTEASMSAGPTPPAAPSMAGMTRPSLRGRPVPPAYAPIKEDSWSQSHAAEADRWGQKTTDLLEQAYSLDQQGGVMNRIKAGGLRAAAGGCAFVEGVQKTAAGDSQQIKYDIMGLAAGPAVGAAVVSGGAILEGVATVGGTLLVGAEGATAATLSVAGGSVQAAAGGWGLYGTGQGVKTLARSETPLQAGVAAGQVAVGALPLGKVGGALAKSALAEKAGAKLLAAASETFVPKAALAAERRAAAEAIVETTRITTEKGSEFATGKVIDAQAEKVRS